MKESLIFVLVIAVIITLYIIKRRKGKKDGESCCGKGYGAKFPDKE